MQRTFLVLALMASVAGCGRFSDSDGARVAPGSRGPVMEGTTNPAGLKVPAHAVSATPSGGFWNCEGTRREHAARCTLHPTVERSAPVRQER